MARPEPKSPWCQDTTKLPVRKVMLYNNSNVYMQSALRLRYHHR